jgi:hypothetical protein
MEIVFIDKVNCYDAVGHTPAETEKNLKKIFDEIDYFLPCIFLLKDIHALQKSQSNEIGEGKKE